MKHLTKITLPALALATIALSAWGASDPAEAKAAPERPGWRALAARAAVRAHIARGLDLSPEQIALAKARRAAAADAIKAIRADATLTREQKMAQARAVAASARAEVRATLTPEQQAKLAAVRERVAARLRAKAAGASTP